MKDGDKTREQLIEELGKLRRRIAETESWGKEQKQAAEELQKVLKVSRQRQMEIAALLEGSQAVLQYRQFKDAACSIFNSCKNLTGATAGYVALLSKDGAENEVLFLDSGGLSCAVNEELPMPIRGLRAEAYRNCQAIYHNDFSRSEWIKFMPPGHVPLNNVLFAPLAIGGKVVGLLGIANKPGGFSEDDARLASGFGELAAIALLNSQRLESLEHSEERFRSVAQSASDAIISTDSFGQIVFWNKAAENMFGYTADETLGKPLTLIMPERFHQVHQEGMQRVAATGKTKIVGKVVELAGIRKDGREFPLDLSVATWQTGEDVFFGGICRDISERKRAKEALRQAHDKLELRVQERTQELSKANKELQAEINERRRAEEALKQTEFKYRSIFNNAVEGIFQSTLDGRFLSANPAMAQMLGYTSPEELIERVLNIRELYSDPNSREEFTNLMQAQGIVKEFEIKVRRNDGREIWVSVNARALKDANDLMTGFEGMAIDITERKQVGKALQLERNNLKGIHDAMADGVYIVNKQYDIEYRNPVIEKEFGEVQGRKCYEYFHDRKEVCPWCKNTEVFAGKSVRWEWYSAKTGKTYDLFDTPFRNPDGSISKLEFFHDITSLKKAEGALRHSEELLRNVLETLPVGVWITEKDGRILHGNPAGQQIWAGAKYVGINQYGEYKGWWAATGEKIEPDEWAAARAIQKGETSLNEEVEIECFEGSHKIILNSAVPIRNPQGEIIGAIIVNQDITERKRAEEDKRKLQAQLLQSQKMESIGALAGGVAHDFNNLLTVIQGHTQLAMLDLNEAEPLYQDLKEVQRASVRAANLTRQLLLFSRKQPMEFSSLNLNTIIEGLVKMLKRLIGEDISVTIELEPNLWTVRADPGNIEQVITNLTVNARDAMPNGGMLFIKTKNVYINEEYCKIYPYARSGKFVSLSIADTGLGMDQEILQRIFEPFFTTKGIGKGTGLGLSVVYGIVKQHEGWINVQSEQKKGSTFQIYLPAISIKPKEEAKESISPQDYQGKGERILLVEDEEGVREFAERALIENGYLVFEAENAEVALKIFDREKGNFHIVFSDVIMPGKNGIELVDQLLGRSPEIRVLLASGYADQRSHWDLIKERAYRFIQKPYALTDLLQVIREVIDKNK